MCFLNNGNDQLKNSLLRKQEMVSEIEFLCTVCQNLFCYFLENTPTFRTLKTNLKVEGKKVEREFCGNG